LQLAGDAGGITGADPYRKVIAPLRDEVKRGQYEESLVLFDRMLAREPGDSEVLYARGEVHRLRDDGGDLERALSDLEAASRAPKAPVETFRALGQVHKQRQDRAAAARAFETYLAQAPQAPDAAMVRSYLAELK
jgi:beta-barrel assembly-enhancing protease